MARKTSVYEFNKQLLKKGFSSAVSAVSTTFNWGRKCLLHNKKTEFKSYTSKFEFPGGNSNVTAVIRMAVIRFQLGNLE